ncbi:hypothetical protein TOPH_06336 [Tolypocladium ophioglossoides CBS 100239]|uniref:Uncharacterized protein n=1 Tax=Tolypocladium ophioglossoides (strain CBS 100239) TaxID=1163406 RepID=A0A0L0N4V9_TOLOC|nr:hypothetical protein TOPH_06336 [Tolypocladium ophioglossoides CBS 100239]
MCYSYGCNCPQSLRLRSVASMILIGSNTSVKPPSSKPSANNASTQSVSHANGLKSSPFHRSHRRHPVAVPLLIRLPDTLLARVPLLGSAAQQGGQLYRRRVRRHGLPQPLARLVQHLVGGEPVLDALVDAGHHVFRICLQLLGAAARGEMGEPGQAGSRPHLEPRLLESVSILARNGTAYSLTKFLTPDVHLNQTAYDEYDEIYVGAQYRWNMFFDYARYASTLINSSFTELLERQRSSENGGGTKVTEQYLEQLNVLQRSYDEIPYWWFSALLLVSFVIITAILATNQLFIPDEPTLWLWPWGPLSWCRWDGCTLFPTFSYPLEPPKSSGTASSSTPSPDTRIPAVHLRMDANAAH